MSKEIVRALRVLCPGHIEDIIVKAGLDDRQAALVRMRFIQLMSVPAVCLALYISPETYHRIKKSILLKIKSYLFYLRVVDEDNPILLFFS